MKGSIYIAVIGDVIRSRDVKDREALQQNLRLAIERVNNTYGETIAAGFVLTIGDEFQGLLKWVAGMEVLLAKLRSAVHPDELRFGLGLGGLDTPLERVALGMDGSCFHRARLAINRAAQRRTEIEVETGTAEPSFHIYAFLYSGIRRGWTERQREVIDLSMSGVSGKMIANRLGITASAVSQHLHAAEAEIVFEASKHWIQAVEEAFRKAGEDG